MIGTRIGTYDVLAKLGKGGMGEVYRAHDTKLHRQVALKILPPQFVADAERKGRFEREARTLAALSHPHIAQIYGLEENALVMELVEGDDLSGIVARGALPLDEALAIAAQIAQALGAAHDQGIVHRDLKPANVKVRADGVVKVLDFGLAKAIDTHGPSALDNSPTVTSPAMTKHGVILGTAAYMSPEQARGKPVDKRTDLWAFGCVLFEMLTGRRAFVGETITDVLAAVVRNEPDWAALPDDTPRQVRTLLRRCLTKDPAQRIADASTARLDLADAQREPDVEQSLRAAAAPRGHERLAWILTAAMAVLAGVAIAFSLTRTAPPAKGAPQVRFDFEDAIGEGVLSPDGTAIVYPPRAGNLNSLVVRTLASGASTTLPDVGGVYHVFWSPDGRSLGFQAAQKLKRLDLATGTVRTLADAATPRGGSWGQDGTILFAPGGNGPIYRVAATGGTPEPVTELTPPQASHRHPIWLPDGRRFLFYVLGPAGVRGEYVGSIGDKRLTRLVDSDGPATFAAPDALLFFREGVLYAQRLDLDAARMIGEARPVASGFRINETGKPRVSASSTGLLAFAKDPDVRAQVQWIDRSGTKAAAVGEPIMNLIGGSLSPDGRTIALALAQTGDAIWLMDVARGTLSRFTDGNRPAWSPDGSRLAFNSSRDGFTRIYTQRIGVNEPAEMLFKSTEAQNMVDWSADGLNIVFSSQSPATARDLWVVPASGSTRTAAPLVQTTAEERNGAISPDGKWLVYESDEDGRLGVFLRPFRGPGRSWRVSPGAGAFAFWRADTREIYFVADGTLSAVAFDPGNGSPTLGAPARLFPLRGILLKARTDGQRFLGASLVDPAPPAVPLTIIVNWAGVGANGVR